MPDGVWPTTLYISEILIRLGMIVVVLLRKKTAPVTLAWITIIVVLPIIGVVLYLLVGEVRLGRRRVQTHRRIVDRIQSVSAMHPLHMQRPEIESRFSHVANLAEAVSDNAPIAGNSLRLMGDPDVFVQSLVEDIDAAAHYCHLLFYIFLDDHSGERVAQSLMRAAKRGVTCRVLVDAVGSKRFLRSDLHRRMLQAGVKVIAAMPVHPLRMLLARIDLRNHRKLAVFDGKCGYTGSQNLADAAFVIKPRFAPWVDCMVRIEGPVIRDLHELFIEDWFMDTNESLEHLLQEIPKPVSDGVIVQVMGTGPGSYNEALRQLSQVAFHAAREELIITTPYFVPDDATLIALCAAGRRGVDTHMVVPARNDSPLVAAASRSHYDSLLESGVKIHEYQGGLLHAKTITIDRDLAVVSTANLDRRSFELNFEISMVVFDDDFASQLRFLQTGYMSKSRQLDVVTWRSRRWPSRLAESAAGTLSPLL